MKAIGTQVVPGNAQTRIATASRPAPLELGALFVRTYDAFAAACRDVTTPGLAIAAIDERTRALAGVYVIAAGEHRTAAVLGRHDACDLWLDADPELALRQLVVIVEPRGDLGPPGYRVFDLRTARGFWDERGRALRGLRCDGPALLRCAGHAVFALPVGDPAAWPARGDDAWARLPERVYFDERVPTAEGTVTGVSRARRVGADVDVPRTHVTAVHGPRSSSGDLVSGDDLAGTLELVGSERRETLQIGHRALGDGVLIGRYARCDSTAGDESVSRVHALLVMVNDELLVVDTASSNGTARPGAEPERVFVAGADLELQLGFETTLRWRWLS